MPPTPKKISEGVAKREADEERGKFVSDECKGKGAGMLRLDGICTPHMRPSDEEQKDYHSGKDKRHYPNTVAAASPGGMLLHVSKTLPGSRNDIVMVGEIGKVIPSMADPRTPDGKRITVVGDAGFRGFGKRLPGVIPVTPHKRTALKELTAAQKKTNEKLSRARSLIERVFERVKRNTILRVPLRGTPQSSSTGSSTLRQARSTSPRHRTTSSTAP